MSLLDIESWYVGERFGISKLIGENISFEPLFIAHNTGLVDVYYSDDADLTAEEIANHFATHPSTFFRLAQKYKHQCIELDKLLKSSNVSNFKKVFELICQTWPFLSIIVVLGEYIEEKALCRIAETAQDLRAEKGTLMYDAVEVLTDLAKKKLPGKENFVNFLTFKEIDTKKIPSESEIVSRRKGYCYFKGSLYANYSRKDLEEKLEVDIEFKRFRKTSVIKGTPASKGRAKGVVRIMLTADSLEKFKEGEILVSPMTTPDFLPAMVRAAAFVTDEGGITSHAAIVSREFGVPCIVGTKVATTVLRTGELVDVNANQGVVKKL